LLVDSWEIKIPISISERTLAGVLAATAMFMMYYFY